MTRIFSGFMSPWQIEVECIYVTPQRVWKISHFFSMGVSRWGSQCIFSDKLKQMNCLSNRVVFSILVGDSLKYIRTLGCYFSVSKMSCTLLSWALMRLWSSSLLIVFRSLITTGPSNSLASNLESHHGDSVLSNLQIFVGEPRVYNDLLRSATCLDSSINLDMISFWRP